MHAAVGRGAGGLGRHQGGRGPVARQADDRNPQEPVARGGWLADKILGSLLLRVIYHYWYHTGENLAIRQALGHTDLPEFVGDIDSEAPYRAE